MSASCGRQHCDFFGRELLVGDHVAFIDQRYQEFRHGEILKLNEKQATIRDLDYNGSFGERMGYGRTVRYYNSIIKETGQ